MKQKCNNSFKYYETGSKTPEFDNILLNHSRIQISIQMGTLNMTLNSTTSAIFCISDESISPKRIRMFPSTLKRVIISLSRASRLVWVPIDCTICKMLHEVSKQSLEGLKVSYNLADEGVKTTLINECFLLFVLLLVNKKTLKILVGLVKGWLSSWWS